MKNTNDTGSVSAETTKETKLRSFSSKDVAEMSIEMLEDLLDSEKGPIRPYRDEDLKNRAKEFLSKEYQSNSFEMKIDRKKGIVYAVSKKKQLESDFASGKEIVGKEYCSLCEKYMKPTNNCAVPDGVECNGMFVQCGSIPCKYFEKKLSSCHRAYSEALDNKWTYHASLNGEPHNYDITVLDKGGWEPIIFHGEIEEKFVEHICKTHNDWLNFKQKNGEKKVKKGNLRRLKNLAWRMKTFRNAFKLIEKNKYLGLDSIKIWIEQNEDDVNMWIFTKWLKNSSNYEDWTWFFHNQDNFIHNIAPNEYSELWDACQNINYFQFGKHISMNGIPEGEWDSYTFHQEYESKLFADGKDFTSALVLEKMFDFAEEYVKHTGYITGEMADKYHIDLHLVEVNADSDVLLDKMDPDTANRVRKIVEDNGSSDPKEKNLEQRVDNLEKMVKDIWQNVCADKKPILEDHNCPHGCPQCRNSKDGCDLYDKGICRGIYYPTDPPQYDPCVFNKKPCEVNSSKKYPEE